MALYHLAKAAEILALYITDGVVEGNYQVINLLDMHFDRALVACDHGSAIQIEPLTRLLAATARQLVNNAIWTVTRRVNSRVTQFVQTLVDKGRGAKALFDVLPPQRRALAEQGLLGSSRNAVVVSLPTSSGKTLIAQFRILQALNQFEHERGWAVYLAPTRSLVRQIARQLRRDFEPLNIVVEQVSSALEIDGVEAGLLNQRDETREFRILVTTPEKLDLMLRQGWEAKIGRPLTLVVVDEAHNIQEGERGLKLELLLATINAECQRAQFLLLTPFINNRREVARWLGGENSDDITFAVDWLPNDRVIGVVTPEKLEKQGRKYGYQLNLETVHTTRSTLSIDRLIPLEKDLDCNKSFSEISHESEIAAATAKQLIKRGPVIVMHGRPDWVWSLANKLKTDNNLRSVVSEPIKLVQDFLALEMGAEFSLIELLGHGIGVHHSGLSHDTRVLMEWLFENGELDYLVATTTIAQGVNFPVSAVVMAAHTYFNKGTGPEPMPAADFWNIAGRAGRVNQGNLGVVALVAANAKKGEKLKLFINEQTGELNSSLIRLVNDAKDFLDDLGYIVYVKPEWSSFLQYLAHTYTQMGKPQAFTDQIEPILRGTFGFGKLRASNPVAANRLLTSIHAYVDEISKPGQPLKLVDSTGFSLQSIKSAMKKASEEGIGKNAWDAETMFTAESDTLKKMMGVLLKVPELRENLEAVTGSSAPNGNKLALIVKDWVNGDELPEIAQKYFSDGRDETESLTNCGKNLFGKLTQTTAWGMGALLSITGGDMPEEERQALNNIASKIYYGVSDDEAIALRLLGVPRSAANPMAAQLKGINQRPLVDVREELRSQDTSVWNKALGADKGTIYRKVWRIIEGLD